MPQLNIHWKGCPHRHLPRITLPSQSKLVDVTTLSQLAAENALHRPLSVNLERLRRVERSRGKQRRRKHSLVRSSTAPQLSLADVPVVQDSEEIELVPLFFGHSKVNRGRTRRAVQSRLSHSQRPKLAGHRKAPPTERRYSLIQLPETSIKPVDLKKSHIATVNKHAHAGPILMASGDHALYRAPYAYNSQRTYDSRLPVKSHSKRSKRTAELSQQRLSTERQSRNLKNLLGQASIQVSRDPIQSFHSLISRSSSQGRALHAFAKDLEKHLALKESQLPPSQAAPSADSLISTHTIVDLMPYAAEFHAAGLSITSAEQRDASKSKSSYRPRRTSTATKRAGMRLDGSATRPLASVATTVVDFPPTDQRSSVATQRTARDALPWLREKARNLSAADECSECVSATTTIIEFHPEDGNDKGKAKELVNDHAQPSTVKEIEWVDVDYNQPGPSRRAGRKRGHLRKPALSPVDDLMKKTKRYPISRILSSSPVKSIGSAQQWQREKVNAELSARFQSVSKEHLTLPSQSPPTLASNSIIENYESHNALSPKLLDASSPPTPSQCLPSRLSTPTLFAQVTPTRPRLATPMEEPALANKNTVSELSNHVEDLADPRPIVSPPPPIQENGNTTPVPTSAKSCPIPAGRSPISMGTGHSARYFSQPGSFMTSSSEDAQIPMAELVRGLQVALAAISNENIDMWIHEVSGCRVRRFIADLGIFEGLRMNDLEVVADQARRI